MVFAQVVLSFAAALGAGDADASKPASLPKSFASALETPILAGVPGALAGAKVKANAEPAAPASPPDPRSTFTLATRDDVNELRVAFDDAISKLKDSLKGDSKAAGAAANPDCGSNCDCSPPGSCGKTACQCGNKEVAQAKALTPMSAPVQAPLPPATTTVVSRNPVSSAPASPSWHQSPSHPNVELFGNVDADGAIRYTAWRWKAGVFVVPPATAIAQPRAAFAPPRFYYPAASQSYAAPYCATGSCPRR